MVGHNKEKKTFYCEVCGLNYTSRELAERCNAWCSEHNSCNLAVARMSIEAASRNRSRK